MACLIYTTWPDANIADDVSRQLLEERLIACSNRLTETQSTYRWEGQITRETEFIVLFKTDISRAGQVRDRLQDLHPYDEPCILVLPVDTPLSSPRFTKWLAEETDVSDRRS